jgi:hypothetical protein
MELDPDAPDNGENGEDEGARMRVLMGFGGFDSTKGKQVEGNQSGAAKLNKPRTWRQYMNRYHLLVCVPEIPSSSLTVYRRGGFNRYDFVTFASFAKSFVLCCLTGPSIRLSSGVDKGATFTNKVMPLYELFQHVRNEAY